jgi:hypothetical protein
MMRQGSRFFRPALTLVQKGRLRWIAGVVPLLLLAACSKPLVLDATLPQQFAEIDCVEQCRLTKEKCIADARYDYRQCEAGYGSSFNKYRWCLASASDKEQCGYPWWSCSENLYGYCTNRHSECQQVCRRGGSSATQ